MRTHFSPQKGAVLAVSLALLLALTLFALAASQATRTQTDFAANIRERDAAFQAAEAALRAGERLLSANGLSECTTPPCRVYPGFPPDERLSLHSADWLRRHAWAYTASNDWIPWSETIAGERSGPDAAAFIIEQHSSAPHSLAVSPDGPSAGAAILRITAAAPARSGRPLVILQSTFGLALERRISVHADVCRDTSDAASAITVNAAAPDSTRVFRAVRDNDSNRGRVVAQRIDARNGARLTQEWEAELDAISPSTLVYAGPPAYRYRDDLEAAPYSSFAAEHRDRPGVVYVTGDDGVLRAFDARTGAAVSSWRPASLFADLRTMTNGKEHNFVTESAAIADAYSGERWRTVLVGVGSGAVYALDVTGASSLTGAQANAQGTPLWAFRAEDADPALLFSRPVVARLRHGAWAILVSEGSRGLLVLDIESGRLIRRMDVGAPSDGPGEPGDSAALSAPSAVDLDADQVVDAAYAGDRRGRLWKFDLTSPDPARWRVAFGGQPLFRARARDGRMQPIAFRPEVARGPSGADAVVLFAAGPDARDALAAEDTNTFYAVLDRGEPVSDDGSEDDRGWSVELPAGVIVSGEPLVDSEHVFVPTAGRERPCGQAQLLAFRIRDGAARTAAPDVAQDAVGQACPRVVYASARDDVDVVSVCHNAAIGRQSWRQVR